MKKQRGIADLWMVAIGLLMLAGIALAVSLIWTRYIASVDKAGYDRGVAETGRKYAERDNAAIEAKNARIAVLEHDRDAAQQAHAKQIAAVDNQRMKEIANAKAQTDRDIAAVRSGNLVLRDPGKADTCGPGCADRGPTRAAGAGPGISDGSAGAQLSQQSAEFLLSLAAEADDVVAQLVDAQTVIRLDRELCK